MIRADGADVKDVLHNNNFLHATAYSNVKSSAAQANVDKAASNWSSLTLIVDKAMFMNMETNPEYKKYNIGSVCAVLTTLQAVVMLTYLVIFAGNCFAQDEQCSWFTYASEDSEYQAMHYCFGTFVVLLEAIKTVLGQFDLYKRFLSSTPVRICAFVMIVILESAWITVFSIWGLPQTFLNIHLFLYSLFIVWNLGFQIFQLVATNSLQGTQLSVLYAAELTTVILLFWFDDIDRTHPNYGLTVGDYKRNQEAKDIIYCDSDRCDNPQERIVLHMLAALFLVSMIVVGCVYYYQLYKKYSKHIFKVHYVSVAMSFVCGVAICGLCIQFLMTFRDNYLECKCGAPRRQRFKNEDVLFNDLRILNQSQTCFETCQYKPLPGEQRSSDPYCRNIFHEADILCCENAINVFSFSQDCVVQIIVVCMYFGWYLTSIVLTLSSYLQAYSANHTSGISEERSEENDSGDESAVLLSNTIET